MDTPRARQALVKLLKDINDREAGPNSNFAIADNIRRIFNRRHNRVPADADIRSHWLGEI